MGKGRDSRELCDYDLPPPWLNRESEAERREYERAWEEYEYKQIEKKRLVRKRK